jgi:exosortase/archaeosortase family protein
VGTTLNWAQGQVLIDGPCSGAKMLYSGLVLAAAHCALFRMNWWKTILFLAGTLVLVVIANALRAGTLFYVEAGFFGALPQTPTVHSMIGLVTFGMLSLSILRSARLFQGEVSKC